MTFEDFQEDGYENEQKVPIVEFDFESFDIPIQQAEPDLTVALAKIIEWLAQGKNAKSKEVRIQAVRYFLGHKNQLALAKEIGVTKACICKAVIQLGDHFKVSAPNMRDEQTREKFSKIQKERSR